MIARLIDKMVSAVSPSAGLRRIVARHALASLAAYAAADRGRRNKDWRADQRSADAAIIADAPLVNARARQTLRDSWPAQSLQFSKTRNIVGRGITPIPVAVDAAGAELAAVNKAAEKLFWDWASCPDHCDVEGRQTFWQKQGLCTDEKFAVGEHFIVWSYVPSPDQVGLKLQSYEPEQLDLTLRQYGDNEVRGGVEVDANGKSVAYHFFLRNPNDYLPSRAMKSVRILRGRVLHYFRPRRVLQVRGISELAPVLQRIRDFHRRDEAEMMVAIMEACMGAVIKRNQPGSLAQGQGVAPDPADTSGGETPGGLRTIDWVPGMVAELDVNEDIQFNTPTRPGGNFEPHARMNLRGIAAGCDTSYDQIARDFDQGTYSSKRQGMLEDWRGWRTEQDLLVDLVVCPVYELWYRFAVLEGRLPVDQFAFAAEPKRYLDAEYVPDGHDWIDPEKEVNAVEKALKLRITTRKEVVARRGGRWLRTLEQLAVERDAAAEKFITFPEDQEQGAAAAPAAATADADGPPGQSDIKPAAGGGQSAAAPDAGVATSLTLNGAQITAALDVMGRVQAGTLPTFAAAELLVAVGIDRPTAEQMIAAAAKTPPPPADPAAPRPEP